MDSLATSKTREHTSQELLRWKLAFEKYQDDFLFDEHDLETSSLLDVGTGSGDFIHYLQNIRHNHDTYGLDLNQESIPPSCSYLTVGTIHALPYADELFDITLSRDLLHTLYLSNDVLSLIPALSELLRVTKKGGYIVYANKGPEKIQQAINKEIEDTKIKETLLQKLNENTKTEVLFLEKLHSLGNTVSIVFRGPRRIVKIEKRALQ